MRKILFALIVSIASSAASAQIFKCIENGKTSFSDSPCPKGAVSIPIDTGNVKPPQQQVEPTNTQTLKDRAKAVTREGRIREIDFDINDKENKIKYNIEAMKQEIARLQRESANADDNKLNALWQQSLATEMKAVSQRYQTENTALQNQIDALRSEKRALIQEGNEEAVDLHRKLTHLAA